jgi:transposase
MPDAEEAAFAASNLAKSDPEAALQQYATYCNLLLDIGRTMMHVQELQLSYWVNRLTTTLVRLRRWREAHDWIERYFALPERYRRRSNPSEEAVLRKRLDRCAQMTRE